ncbi:PD-(D/E)XK nuclease family protein [Neobacillus dielmonensis]|uniref:PD-(D/E)XK nuclease family protein n=1 Tax=Neobacillus dielmonensis TaxID=1347369 RepID=UPI0005A8D349|nr:PD-(D/E)XK nuclease family protein [Neobacillus dielmonensis]
MNIILGYWLDSSSYPDALGDKEAEVGTVVTGFNGLIGILETQLGLTSPEVSENIRIAEWQELIRVHDNGNMPFSKSFETDSWNTAKELLRRRDELILAGWDPSIHMDGSKWLQTLAQLELANPNKTKGFSDRVLALLSKLQESVSVNIDTITMVDEDETIWDPWAIQLIDRIKACGVEVQKQTPTSTIESEQGSSSDLALLQSVLSGEISFGQAQGDGSLLLVRSEQEWDAADYLISWLQENGTDNTVLMKGEGSLLLDELLHRRGMPSVGVETPSKWRAVLQVLALTIDTYWAPIRVERMLELLTIPTSPVPGRIRYKLAHALSSYPGIGSPQWMQAIEEGIRISEEKWMAEGLDEQEQKKRRKNLEEKLDIWVRHEYYDPNEGIPYEKLVQICQKVTEWATTNYSMTNDQLYVQAIRHAQEVVEGVKSLGVQKVTHLQVERILESVLGDGAKLPDYGVEASKWQMVQHPGQIWGQADTVIWWGFVKNMSGPSARTWTSQERAWLKEHGVQLADESVSRQREAESWKRAARLAKRKLILFAPARVNGKEIPIHPFWDEIRFAVANDTSTVSKITIEADRLRKQPSQDPMSEGWERVALKRRPIPDPIRTWNIPENVVWPRQEESATSFESLIGCPLKWTFRYAANIQPGNVLSLPNESRMLGNLGHAILENLIMEKSSWGREEVKIRAGELFDELSPLMAAPLLELQNSITRNETRFKLQNSLQQFFTVLDHAGIQISHTELELRKSWKDGVDFKGRLDLVGETGSGNKILFDAKWSKWPRSYKERLETLSVQLTLYHWLLTDHEEEELPVAYFMLRSGDFFSLPHDDFPSDYHVEGPSLLESHAVLRKAVEDVWAQLQTGTIIAPGIPETEQNKDMYSGQGQSFEPFASVIDPPCTFCEYHNLCGLRRVKK